MTKSDDPKVLAAFDDVFEASMLAVGSFRDFAMSESGQQAIRRMITDNMTSEDDSFVQVVVLATVGCLIWPGFVIDGIFPFSPPSFSAVPHFNPANAYATSLPHGVQAVTLFRDRLPPKVLIAEDCGYKRTILLCNATYADVIVQYTASISRTNFMGDIAADLLAMVLRQPPVWPRPAAPPDPVMITFEGHRLLACPRGISS